MKLSFAKSAALADPTVIFNSSLDGSVRRAVDIDAEAFKTPIVAATALNTPGVRAKRVKQGADLRTPCQFATFAFDNLMADQLQSDSVRAK